jgi:hypothetical protein
MDADNIGAQLPHLAEVGLDLGPFLFPIILDQPALLVVIVIEPPGRECLLRSGKYKAVTIVGDADSREVVGMDGRGAGHSADDDDREQETEMRRVHWWEHSSRRKGGQSHFLGG